MIGGFTARIHGRRRPGWPAAPVALLATLIVGCGASAGQEADGAPPPERVAGTPTEPTAEGGERRATSASSREKAPGSAAREAASAAPRPERVQIPRLGVDAPVIELGLNPDRTLEVPVDYDDVGWWKGGFAPGERGPAVLAGHVDSRTGPAVFHRLNELEAGDRVLVRLRDGSGVRFVVQRLEEHPKDDFPTERVYGPTSRSELRLVTCSGDFDSGTGHYEDNTIAFAVRG